MTSGGKQEAEDASRPVPPARETLILTGNHAASFAVKAARVQVISAYPITPQSPVVEKLSEFVEDGELKARMIRVESEQSAMASLISASTTGTRVFTATSSHGLSYMHEQLAWAAGTRLPVVMCIVTRAIGAPWSVWPDHQDAVSERDTGWIQIFCEDNQEIYDTVLEAYKIAEDERVYLPVAVCYDGYILSHTLMPVELMSQAEVDKFLPPFKSHLMLAMSMDDPVGVNPVTVPEPREGFPAYMELRHRMQKALEGAAAVMEEVEAEFAKVSGRHHGGAVRSYRLDDAEVALVGMGSCSSQAKVAIDDLRAAGIKAGVLTVRLFRPFPKRQIREVLKGKKVVAVFDRDVAYGLEGALCAETKASLYGIPDPPYVHGFIVGIGGRDFTTENAIEGTRLAVERSRNREIHDETTWLNLMEGE
ncbi:MAG: pyruvate ferredoxin oxidoreductase [Candidatus Lokiarchaeota archaeon]|nr:pyruvate ferredoxin oxidoreductase [Candidatus Lokiarchaeota archaeon]